MVDKTESRFNTAQMGRQRAQSTIAAKKQDIGQLSTDFMMSQAQLKLNGTNGTEKNPSIHFLRNNSLIVGQKQPQTWKDKFNQAAEFTKGALQGAYNPKKTGAQTALDIGVNMLPNLGILCDIRDISAYVRQDYNAGWKDFNGTQALRYAPYVIGSLFLGHMAFKKLRPYSLAANISKFKIFKNITETVSEQSTRLLDKAAVKVFGGDGKIDVSGLVSNPKIVGNFGVLTSKDKSFPHLHAMSKNDDVVPFPSVIGDVLPPRQQLVHGAYIGKTKANIIENCDGAILIDGKRATDIAPLNEITRNGKIFDDRNILSNPKNLVYSDDFERFKIYQANMALARLRYAGSLDEARHFSDGDFLMEVASQHELAVKGFKSYDGMNVEYAGNINPCTFAVTYGLLKDERSLELLELARKSKNIFHEEKSYLTGKFNLPGWSDPLIYNVYKNEPDVSYMLGRSMSQKNMVEVSSTLNTAHKKALSDISDGTQAEALNSIADYYQYAIASHLFSGGNNSLFMNQVNYLLKLKGLKPVLHGELDAWANFLPQHIFRKEFSDYVLRAQSI